jgi:hypothetical protein
LWKRPVSPRHARERISPGTDAGDDPLQRGAPSSFQSAAFFSLPKALLKTLNKKVRILVMSDIIPVQKITSRIYEIRSQRVMLDRDLAELYDMETRNLKRQVNRNKEHFPKGFMFELTREELKNLRSQIGTSSWGRLPLPSLCP